MLARTDATDARASGRGSWSTQFLDEVVFLIPAACHQILDRSFHLALLKHVLWLIINPKKLVDGLCYELDNNDLMKSLGSLM
jgi:hypothetical protein